jgi:drug/metabolite transporter (DMT)-like permease
MNPIKIVAVVLIVAGILGLIYGGFTFTKDSHDAKLGPIEFSVKEKERVNIPSWAGVAAIVLGGVLLVVPFKR